MTFVETTTVAPHILPRYFSQDLGKYEILVPPCERKKAGLRLSRLVGLWDLASKATEYWSIFEFQDGWFHYNLIDLELFLLIVPLISTLA